MTTAATNMPEDVYVAVWTRPCFPPVARVFSTFDKAIAWARHKARRFAAGREVLEKEFKNGEYKGCSYQVDFGTGGLIVIDEQMIDLE